MYCNWQDSCIEDSCMEEYFGEHHFPRGGKKIMQMQVTCEADYKCLYYIDNHPTRNRFLGSIKLKAMMLTWEQDPAINPYVYFDPHLCIENHNKRLQTLMPLLKTLLV